MTASEAESGPGGADAIPGAQPLRRPLAVTGTILLLAFLLAPLFCQASEDALILFQYSANLAHDGVISFIPHGPPAEGATDFLWMVYLATGTRLGIPIYGMAIATSAACVVLLAMLLLRLAKQRVDLWNICAIVCLVLLAPQSFAAEAGFSVFAFALPLALMAALALLDCYGWAALAGLLLCLIRPDGVLFALPLLAVYLFRGGGLTVRFLKLAAGFLLPGLAYFLWRWHYFGHLLPLPFYVKSDTPRLWGILVARSAAGLAPSLLAACAVLAVALRKEALATANLLLFGALVLPSSCFYLAMRLDQNYASRFFLYPLVAMAVLLAFNYEAFRTRSSQVLLAGLGIWALILAYFWINWSVIYTLEYSQPHVVAVARRLQQLPDRGTMIVSETGAIPYYSQWAAYDPWGLNTPAFARKLIRPLDVSSLHPDLVILNPGVDPVPCALTPGELLPHTTRTWHNMTQNVIAGVDQNQYVQWMLPEFNDYYRFHPRRWSGEMRLGRLAYQCWFIRKSYPQSAQVFEILKQFGGISAANYEVITQEGRDPAGKTD